MQLQILAHGKIKKLLIIRKQLIHAPLPEPGTIQQHARSQHDAQLLEHPCHAVRVVGRLLGADGGAELEDVAAEIVGDGVAEEGDLHEVEGDVEVGGKVVETALSVPAVSGARSCIPAQHVTGGRLAYL